MTQSKLNNNEWINVELITVSFSGIALLQVVSGGRVSSKPNHLDFEHPVRVHHYIHPSLRMKLMATFHDNVVLNLDHFIARATTLLFSSDASEYAPLWCITTLLLCSGVGEYHSVGYTNSLL